MINSVCLIGNLAADPEIRSTQRGVKVAKMRMAVNDFWNDRGTGERHKRTHWFSLNAWDRLADICEQYLRQGMKIAVRGSLEYQEWTNPEGQKRSRIEVRVRELEILTPRDSKPNYDKSRSTDERPTDSDYPGDDYEKSGNERIEDDDIPF